LNLKVIKYKIIITAINLYKYSVFTKKEDINFYFMTGSYNLTLCFGYSPIKNTSRSKLCHWITWI